MLRQHWMACPPMIRFLLVHFADGVALGWSCGLAILWLDVAGLGSAMATGDSALLTAIFFAQGGLLFGTTAMSVAVMTLSVEKE